MTWKPSKIAFHRGVSHLSRVPLPFPSMNLNHETLSEIDVSFKTTWITQEAQNDKLLVAKLQRYWDGLCSTAAGLE